MCHKFFFLMSFWVTLAAHAQEPANILNTATQKQVMLSSSVNEVLKKWDPNFSIYEISMFAPSVVKLYKGPKDGLPMAILGDFNGDQKQDIALMGKSLDKEKVVILIAKNNSFTAVQVHSQQAPDPLQNQIESASGVEQGLSFYLSLLSSAELKVKSNQDLIKPDALQLENYLGTTSAYYLKPNRKKSFDVVEYKGIIKK